MNGLIEEFLRTRGVRFFRGHHDNEYFFLVDVVGRFKRHLNVHLESIGPNHDTVRLSITADRYYPADGRESLDEIVERWNADAPVLHATLHDSCDSRLVGLVASGEFRPSGLAELTTLVDSALAGAVTLFSSAADAAGPPQQSARVLRDAG